MTDPAKTPLNKEAYPGFMSGLVDKVRNVDPRVLGSALGATLGAGAVRAGIKDPKKRTLAKYLAGGGIGAGGGLLAGQYLRNYADLQTKAKDVGFGGEQSARLEKQLGLTPRDPENINLGVDEGSSQEAIHAAMKRLYTRNPHLLGFDGKSPAEDSLVDLLHKKKMWGDRLGIRHEGMKPSTRKALNILGGLTLSGATLGAGTPAGVMLATRNSKIPDRKLLHTAVKDSLRNTPMTTGLKDRYKPWLEGQKYTVPSRPFTVPLNEQEYGELPWYTRMLNALHNRKKAASSVVDNLAKKIDSEGGDIKPEGAEALQEIARAEDRAPKPDLATGLLAGIGAKGQLQHKPKTV